MVANDRILDRAFSPSAYSRKDRFDRLRCVSGADDRFWRRRESGLDLIGEEEARSGLLRVGLLTRLGGLFSLSPEFDS